MSNRKAPDLYLELLILLRVLGLTFAMPATCLDVRPVFPWRSAILYFLFPAIHTCVCYGYPRARLAISSFLHDFIERLVERFLLFFRHDFIKIVLRDP